MGSAEILVTATSVPFDHSPPSEVALVSLEAVSSHIPSRRVRVSEYLRRYGFSEKRIDMHIRYFGFGEVPCDPGEGPVAQLVAAAAGLGLRGREHRVRYVLHARTMPVTAPYPVNPLRRVCEELGLAHSTVFTLTQHACASSLLAVQLAGQLLADDGDPDARALVLAGEKTFTSAAQVIADTGVMGEGAAAILVAPQGMRDRVLGYATHTLGEFHSAPWSDEATSARFNQIYPKALAEVMLAAVETAGLTLDDITLVLPHNVNRMSWLRVLHHLGIQGSGRLFLDNLATLGHCFGADAFINLQSARAQGRLRTGDRSLMTAVGLGATFSAMVLQH